MSAFRRSRLLTAVLVVHLAVHSLAVSAAPPGCTHSVGSGADCDHGNLASALLAAAFSSAPSTVCLTGSHSNVDFDLVNFDQGGSGLTIRGGYASCSASMASGFSVLTGDGSDPAFDIRANAGRQSLVRLERIAVLSAAPAVRAGAGARVDLINSILERNVRGIEAVAGAVVSTDALTEIVDNTHPTDGAGIFCENARVDVAGLVSGNAVTSGSGSVHRGGGFQGNNCALNLLEGAWFAENRARSGAAISLFNSIVRGGGTGPVGVRIIDNVAVPTLGQRPGSAAIGAGSGSDVLLGNVRIEGNSGSSIVSVTNSRVQLERFNFETCAEPPRCATISGNEAIATVAVGDGGTFRMMQGYIEGNLGVGSSDFHSLFEGGDATAQIELDGIQIHGNRVDAIFDTRVEGQVRGGFLSVARNGPDPLSPDVRIVLASIRGSVALNTSILQDHRSFAGTPTTLDCVIAQTLGGVTATRSITSTDPGFVDAVGGDLHLRVDSIAIDYCDTSVYAPLDTDFDLDPRGQEDPRVNRFGRFDAGADERPPGSPPPDGPIFSNGFE